VADDCLFLEDNETRLSRASRVGRRPRKTFRNRTPAFYTCEHKLVRRCRRRDGRFLTRRTCDNRVATVWLPFGNRARERISCCSSSFCPTVPGPAGHCYTAELSGPRAVRLQRGKVRYRYRYRFLSQEHRFFTSMVREPRLQN